MAAVALGSSFSGLAGQLLIKGSLTRDFRLRVFFMNQCPPGSQVFHWGRFEFFRKFAEIFANEYMSPVSTTPAINPCYGEVTKSLKLFGGVNDIGN